MNRPLEGIRVLDLTQAYSGPYCTMNLADHGAEAIKIERPGTGDQTRGWGPMKNDYSGYYAYINRNKKGITLNLASEEGKKIFRELVKTADVVCEKQRYARFLIVRSLVKKAPIPLGAFFIYPAFCASAIMVSLVNEPSSCSSKYAFTSAEALS